MNIMDWITPTANRVCETCRFVEFDESRGGYWCHRFPPIVGPDGVSKFPSTRSHNWCGEWRSK